MSNEDQGHYHPTSWLCHKYKLNSQRNEKRFDKLNKIEKHDLIGQGHIKFKVI